MSILSSSSTLAQVQAAYDDNASYAEDASTAKALAFITACRILLRRIAKRAVHGGRAGEEIEFDPQVLREELLAAQRWYQLNTTATVGCGIVHVDLEDFRD